MRRGALGGVWEQKTGTRQHQGNPTSQALVKNDISIWVPWLCALNMLMRDVSKGKLDGGEWEHCSVFTTLQYIQNFSEIIVCFFFNVAQGDTCQTKVMPFSPGSRMEMNCNKKLKQVPLIFSPKPIRNLVQNRAGEQGLLPVPTSIPAPHAPPGRASPQRTRASPSTHTSAYRAGVNERFTCT